MRVGRDIPTTAATNVLVPHRLKGKEEGEQNRQSYLPTDMVDLGALRSPGSGFHPTAFTLFTPQKEMEAAPLWPAGSCLPTVLPLFPFPNFSNPTAPLALLPLTWDAAEGHPPTWAHKSRPVCI